ncbi:ATP-binding cassette domain-containing protein, partial [Staphylococcus felis]
DINELNSERLKEKILYIDSTPFLFTGTIQENICMNNKISSQKLNSIIETCNLQDIIQNCQKGIYHVVSENASNLSTGQKQRISLARALVKQPDFLIIDEALSNLDEFNFNKILKNLIKQNFGLIIISHNEFSDTIYDKKFEIINHKLILK